MNLYNFESNLLFTLMKINMLKSSLILFLTLFISGIYAQKRVILESGSTTTIFGGASPFVDAYNAAVDGDIIYLPGGSLVPPSGITKSLTIYGVGHHPDYSTATEPTTITSNISLYTGADNFKLEGVLINGGIVFYTNNAIDNAVISRCKFSSLSFSGTRTTPCLNATIKECVITTAISLSNALDITITNCIIENIISNGSNANIINNLFLYDAAYNYEPIENVDNSTISNNIFIKDDFGIQANCDASTFEKNIFTTATVANQGNSTFIDNYLVADLSSFFVSQSGNVFDYTHDYTLSGENATTYTGTNASQVGIYGGLFPYKNNQVPSTPHISDQSIASSTDENGNLSISITVEAQNE